MKTLVDLVPDTNDLLALHPEEIGGVILQVLVSTNRNEQHLLNRINFINDETLNRYPRDKWQTLKQALMEGWVWLENEGLIAPDPTSRKGIRSLSLVALNR